MRVADFGEVFGHFLLPFGEDELEAGDLKSALQKARQRWAEDKRPHTTLEKADLWTVAGQCDSILHLRLSDFRFVSELQSRFVDPRAQASSWVFSIPHCLQSHSKPEARLPGAIEFLTYLRVNRVLYREHGCRAEAALFATLEKLLAQWRPKGVVATIHHTVGWPDLLLHGHFATDAREFLRFQLTLQELFVPITTEEAQLPLRFRRQTGSIKRGRFLVFRKTLTLLAFHPHTVYPSAEQVDTSRLEVGEAGFELEPSVFVRHFPGRHFDAAQAVLTSMPLARADSMCLHSLDGTWDFFISAREKKVVASARELYDQIRGRHLDLHEAGVDRMHTHLVSVESVASAAHMRDEVESSAMQLDLAVSLQDPCSCRDTDFRRTQDLLEEAERQGHLPDSLRATIANTLGMFQQSLGDSTNCCDSAQAIQAHLEGLDDLLVLLSKLRTTANSRDSFRETLDVLEHLEAWCTLAGRVLRERTAGSFQRLLLQVDSRVAHRGSIPKILYLAENLMQEFLARVKSQLGTDFAGSRRNFSAVYEPQGTITSYPPLGLVNIPIRYAFALPVVLPQLWHEVGQQIYYQRHFLGPLIGRSRGPLHWPSEESVELSLLEADLFSDLIVFTFGFQGEQLDFLRYLSTLVLEDWRYNGSPEAVWEGFNIELFLRLFHVSLFQSLFQTLREHRPFVQEEVARLLRSESDLLLTDTKVEDALETLLELLEEHVLDQPRYQLANVKSPRRLSRRLIREVTAAFQKTRIPAVTRDLLEQLWAAGFRRVAGGVAVDEEKWQALTHGELVELERHEVDAYYCRFYREQLDRLLTQDTGTQAGRFRLMAALGRSGVLAFHHHPARRAPVA